MVIAIVTSGFLPVPASRGGAVEALIENLLKENESFQEFQFEVISIFEKKAAEISKQYQHSHFVFITPPKLICSLDRLVYWLAKNCLNLKKCISFRYIFQRLYFIRKTASLLHDNQYDKVLIENNPTLFLSLNMKKNYIKYRDRYYYHLHNEVTNDFHCGDLIRNCKKILTVSSFINQSLNNFLHSIAFDKLCVLRNCIDMESFTESQSSETRASFREKYGIKEYEKVILFTGRLTEEKGIRELLLAFKKVEYPDAKLVIAGSYFVGTGTASKFEKELHVIADSLPGKIIFTGYVPYTEMPGIYSIADIAALPSVWDDPAPLADIEAMACGLPIITTNSGGIPEYLNKSCAVMIKRDENLIPNLTVAIEELLANKNLRLQMSAAARKASSNLTLDNYYRNFVKIITE